MESKRNYYDKWHEVKACLRLGSHRRRSRGVGRESSPRSRAHRARSRRPAHVGRGGRARPEGRSLFATALRLCEEICVAC